MNRVLAIVSAGVLLVSIGLARAADHPQDAAKLVLKQKGSGKQSATWVTKRGAVVLPTTSPVTSGASLTIQGANESQTVQLPGTDWSQNAAGTTYKYVNKEAPGGSSPVKLVVIKSKSIKVVSKETLIALDDPTQGTVSISLTVDDDVYCSRCTTPSKDAPGKYVAKSCGAPPNCSAVLSSTTTSTPGSSSTSTTLGGGGSVLKGALTPTVGRFNYNLMIGLPAADAACNTNFAGTHACSYAELQSAEAAGDLVGLKDTASTTVTSFWAIDNSANPLQQCQDDAAGGSMLNWEYATAHTASRGQKVNLNNGAGTLGPLQTSLQCNFSGDSWVGCCS